MNIIILIVRLVIDKLMYFLNIDFPWEVLVGWGGSIIGVIGAYWVANSQFNKEKEKVKKNDKINDFKEIYLILLDIEILVNETKYIHSELFILYEKAIKSLNQTDSNTFKDKGNLFSNKLSLLISKLSKVSMYIEVYNIENEFLKSLISDISIYQNILHMHPSSLFWDWENRYYDEDNNDKPLYFNDIINNYNTQKYYYKVRILNTIKNE